MTTTVAVFTRDLRVRDNPMLAAAARGADQVVPLFVRDGKVAAFSARRTRFLDESLSDVDASLRHLGGRLVLREGDPVEEVCRVAGEVGADRVHIAGDVSAYARTREERLRSGLTCEFVVHDDVHTVVPPGLLTPSGKDHFAVFSAYHRQWDAHGWRQAVPTPRRIEVPKVKGRKAPSVRGEGGESAARRRMTSWLRTNAESYTDNHDMVAVDGTSRLSPYLHLGCLSALELARRGDKAPDFVRQLAWRDFHHQVLNARPDAAHEDYRPRGDRWRDDDHAFDAWRAGETGIPIVDAGMRQLLAEGWMHNRARLVVASFLTKTLYLDWRAGAAHFYAHLIDGDIANNSLNWQWVAGTGTDTRPNRVLNPMRQAERFDPRDDYVRRYVPELSGVDDARRPWTLSTKARNGYPLPIVDLAEGRARFLAARG
ncbi:cryptochrome/photolyase family protein [Actinophytocola oryzae]|uniref:Deoxyribodipyrimidine photo-lyase n=1 Tax=Actinophytocola oryzae TaxID=502181 RepID=A0A4R7V1K9_9PSEU|nr:deoxyribodipyrimidine photo-lyase [Actinophytocola oryzae]TDV41725.1 deoxyribodipyrimidine photo-lyase [Actinophytocola oryzae]